MPKKTPLHDVHQQLGANMVDFAGWLMPLHYGSQINEHHGVRTKVGVFDVSHMGIIDIKGNEAHPFLRYILANDVKKINENQALYTCMLNEQGGVKDDLIVYCFGENDYRLVVNASTQEKDYAWIKEKSSKYDVALTLRNDLGILAIQGPLTFETIQNVFSEKQNQAIAGLKPFHVVNEDKWVIAYTGYTGEQGLEIMLPLNELVDVWQQLLRKGVMPCGLGARDSLRLEAGLNLYGQDMDETTTPLVSNLSWTVDFKDADRNFIGKQALFKQQQEGLSQQLQGIVLIDKGVCRAGMKIYEVAQDEPIGELTSGGFSPTLTCGIGLARIKIGSFKDVSIEVRGKKIKAKIIKPPFVKKGKANIYS